jgi:CubicO group peptidase (beta-lactamase class C family)
MRTRLTFLFLVLFCALGFQISAQNLYFPPKTGSVWETIAPETLGFCPAQIDSLYQFLDARHTKSFILLKDGKIVLEKYFGTFKQDSLWYWASAGKSLSAFMVGMAQESGILDIQQPTSTYLGAGWSSCPANKEALIKVRNQLTMTTGLDDAIPATPMVPDPDNCTTPSCLVYKADAGTRWAYHNAPYRLIHNVIEAASGKTIQQFTKLNVLDRTGMKGFWLDHVMYGRARDMARFGLLIQAQGRWGTDTLLHDPTYFYDMTHRSQQLNKSYGYLWWLNGQETFMLPYLQLVLQGSLFPNAPADDFAALGKNDQKIHVVPSKGWVIIRQGDAAGYVGPGGGQVPIYFDIDLWKYLNLLECTPSATTEANSETVQVWPNPTTSAWEIQANEPISEAALYHVDGRLAQQYQVAETTNLNISAGSLPAGFYWLKMLIGNKIQIVRLVKS